MSAGRENAGVVPGAGDTLELLQPDFTRLKQKPQAAMPWKVCVLRADGFSIRIFQRCATADDARIVVKALARVGLPAHVALEITPQVKA